MAKIQKLRDYQDVEVYPYTIERAVYDSDGYTLEKKLSEIKADDLYGPVNYDGQEINVADLYKYDYNLGTTNYGISTDYKHSIVLVQPGQIVKITTGAATRMHFFSYIKRSSTNATLPSVFYAWMKADMTYYFHVPDNANALGFNRGTEENDASPRDLTILTPKSKAPTSDVHVVRVDRFRISSNQDKLVGVDSSSAVDAAACVFPVKAGERYYIFPTYNDELHMGYIQNIPYNNEPLTGFLEYNAAKFRVSGFSLFYVASADGYYFMDCTKTEDAELSVVVKREISQENQDRVETLDTVGDSVKNLLTFSEGYEPIDLSAFEERKYLIDFDTALYGSTSSYKHVLVPVTPGQKIKVIRNANKTARFAWLTSDSASVSNTPPAYVEGTRVFTIRSREAKVMTVPPGAEYLLVHKSGYEPTFLGIYNGDISGGDATDKTDILYQNPDTEFGPKLLSANKRYYTSSSTTSPYPLVIAHLSDIHGNWTNVMRFLRFCDHYGSKIQVRLNTGDTVESWLYNGSGKSGGAEKYAAIEGVESILCAIGNHDTALYNSGTWSWREYAGKVAYDAFFAPHISNWGVVQPSGAEENGFCYYYKDYADKDVRLVVTDVMGYGDTQDAWLASVLSDARTNGYHVVIGTHFAGGRPSGEGNNPAFEKVASNYTTLYEMGTTASGLHTFAPESYKMMDTVDSFQRAGGIFVGYIQGHYHADFVAKVAKYPSQLIYSIGATKAGETRDYSHGVGTRDQDEFQIVSIDTYGKLVKLYKVGANVDRYARHKNAICINYGTRTVISEAY